MDHFGRGRNANSFALFVSVVCLGLCSFRVPAHAVEGPATVPLDGGPLGMLDFSAGADGYFYAQSGTSNNSNNSIVGDKATGAEPRRLDDRTEKVYRVGAVYPPARGMEGCRCRHQ